MSAFTSEQKLRLVHAIREEHRNNQASIQMREQILKGNPISMPLVEKREISLEEDSMPELPRSSFRIRFCIAILAFAGFVWMDTKEISVNGLDTITIQSRITENFEINVFDFIDTIPYTLRSMQKEP